MPTAQTGTFPYPAKGASQDGVVALGEIPPGGYTSVKLSVTPSATMTGTGTGLNRGRSWELTEVDTLGQVIQGVGVFVHHDGMVSAADVARSVHIVGGPLTAGNLLVFRTAQGTPGYKIADPGGSLDLALA